MGNDERVTAAISAAVSAYIRAQEEEAQLQSMVAPTRITSMWSLAGRQEIMSQRQYWQLKMFNGYHLQRSAFLKTGFDPLLARPRAKTPVLLSVSK